MIIESPRNLGDQSAAISREIVRIIADHTGRGPTRVCTTIAADVVCVVLQDILTKGERALLANGEHALVTEVRRAYHRAMQPALTQAAEAITSREVRAVLSAHDPDADVSTISVVLAPLLATRTAAPRAANSNMRDPSAIEEGRAAADRRQAAEDRVTAAVTRHQARTDLQQAVLRPSSGGER